VTPTALGNGFGFVRGDTTEKSLAFKKVAVLVSDPVTNGVGACEPTVLPGKNLWSNATLVGTIWACTMPKKGEDGLGVAISGGKVEGCGTGCANYGGRRGARLVRETTG
jgi:hypothetical protein